MKISSPVFGDNQPIPRKYGCRGEGKNPELRVEGVPSSARSLALVVDDPDAPMGNFAHWVMFNIPPSISRIPEGSAPGAEGINSSHTPGYVPPCPPSGTHRYFFRLYALDTELALGPGQADKPALEKAMRGHVLDQAELVGTFSH